MSKVGKVQLNGHSLVSPIIKGDGVPAKLEQWLVKFMTIYTVQLGECKTITDKIRLGIKLSGLKMALYRLRELCERYPEPLKSTPEPPLLGCLVNQEFVLGAVVDPSQVVFTKCSNMTEEYFGKANANSPYKYDLILHLGSRNEFQVFAAYRASESFAHPIIFKGHFK